MIIMAMVTAAAKKTKIPKTPKAITPPIFSLPLFGPDLTADVVSEISLSNGLFKLFLFLLEGFFVGGVVEDGFGGAVLLEGNRDEGFDELGLDVVVGKEVWTDGMIGLLFL